MRDRVVEEIYEDLLQGDPVHADGGQVRWPATQPTEHERLFSSRSPGLWAMVSIAAIGLFNLMGPKHTAGFAIFAPGGMVVITVLVVAFALPFVDWRHLDLGRPPWDHSPLEWWRAFVFVVLALSGVEAIANLTGVMTKPVYHTARRAIWLVAGEVALFNLLLAVAMVTLAPPREAHVGDMMAYIAQGPHGERPGSGGRSGSSAGCCSCRPQHGRQRPDEHRLRHEP